MDPDHSSQDSRSRTNHTGAWLRGFAWGLPLVIIAMLLAYLAMALASKEHLLAYTLEQEGRNAEKLAGAKADQIEMLFFSADTVLRQFRDQYAAGQVGAARKTIQTAFDTFPAGALVHFSVVDTAGFVRFSTLPQPGPIYLGDRGYFIAHQQRPEDRPLVNRPVLTRATNTWVTLLTRPILRKGMFAGVAVMSVSPHYLSAALAQLKSGPNDVISLVLRDGHFLARDRDLEKVLGSRLPADRAFLRPNAPETGVTRQVAFVDHRERIYGWKSLHGFPMIVVVGIDEGDVLAQVHAESRQTWIRAGIAAPLVLLLTFTLSWLLIRSARQQSHLVSHDALLSATLNSTDDGILVVRNDGQILAMNNRFRAMWHIPDRLATPEHSRELIEQAAAQLIHPKEFLGRVDDPGAGGESGRNQVEFTDGRVFQRHTQQLAQGGQQAHLWSFRDITARYRAEQALIASEGRLRLTQEAAEVGVWEWDMSDGSYYRSPECLRLYGLRADETCDNDRWRSLIHPDDLPKIDAELGEHIARHELFEVEYRLRLPSGEYRWLVTKGRAQYDRAGKVLRLAGITMNIGDRKLAEATRDSLEQQVREAQKMEAIGTLAGGIAHDFNNILGAILGNVALARLDLSAGHAALTRLEQIAISGARARSLVEQILAFSRHDPPTLKPQLLGAIVHETAALLRATLPATVRLTVVTPDEPLRVRGDATQLEQVLLNLCTNAWHALPAGAGSIEVRLDSLNVGPTADAGAAVLAPPAPALATGRYAHLSVVDDGCGMDAATRARIFEPFFTTKLAGQGTGLGLSVVHGIVTSHGGTITVSSRPGAGCRFDLYIPQLEVSAVMAGPGPDSDAKLLVRGQGQHVLYVDDDEVMLLMVEHLLLNLGYLATCLADPRAAIATVRTRADEFDVVVTDLNMPQMSGLDAAKALHDIDPKLPVVITSGFISEQLRVDAQLVGVVALMRKEHTLEELGAMVELALAVRRQAAGPG